MTKKCNCKKCIHCKQIVTSTSIFRVNCKKYGDDKFEPTYCDQYKTLEDTNRIGLVLFEETFQEIQEKWEKLIK